jgi:hypothetical protein
MKTASCALAAVLPLLLPFVLAVLLALPSAHAQQQVLCTEAQFLADACSNSYISHCEVGVQFQPPTPVCPVGTDCFDCDPCQQHRFEGCGACTADPQGCLWCGSDALCISQRSLNYLPTNRILTCKRTDFVQTCAPTPGDVFQDPLYDADSWIFDQINIKPVWQAGISK